jgi:hypothetical protein
MSLFAEIDDEIALAVTPKSDQSIYEWAHDKPRYGNICDRVS